jgi:hypothetical protein
LRSARGGQLASFLCDVRIRVAGVGLQESCHGALNQLEIRVSSKASGGIVFSCHERSLHRESVAQRSRIMGSKIVRALGRRVEFGGESRRSDLVDRAPGNLP